MPGRRAANAKSITARLHGRPLRIASMPSAGQHNDAVAKDPRRRGGDEADEGRDLGKAPLRESPKAAVTARAADTE